MQTDSAMRARFEADGLRIRSSAASKRLRTAGINSSPTAAAMGSHTYFGGGTNGGGVLHHITAPTHTVIMTAIDARDIGRAFIPSSPAVLLARFPVRFAFGAEPVVLGVGRASRFDDRIRGRRHQRLVQARNRSGALAGTQLDRTPVGSWEENACPAFHGSIRSSQYPGLRFECAIAMIMHWVSSTRYISTYGNRSSRNLRT